MDSTCALRRNGASAYHRVTGLGPRAAARRWPDVASCPQRRAGVAAIAHRWGATPASRSAASALARTVSYDGATPPPPRRPRRADAARATSAGRPCAQRLPQRRNRTGESTPGRRGRARASAALRTAGLASDSAGRVARARALRSRAVRVTTCRPPAGARKLRQRVCRIRLVAGSRTAMAAPHARSQRGRQVSAVMAGRGGSGSPETAAGSGRHSRAPVNRAGSTAHLSSNQTASK